MNMCFIIVVWIDRLINNESYQLQLCTVYFDLFVNSFRTFLLMNFLLFSKHVVFVVLLVNRFMSDCPELKCRLIVFTRHVKPRKAERLQADWRSVGTDRWSCSSPDGADGWSAVSPDTDDMIGTTCRLLTVLGLIMCPNSELTANNVYTHSRTGSLLSYMLTAASVSFQFTDKTTNSVRHSADKQEQIKTYLSVETSYQRALACRLIRLICSDCCKRHFRLLLLRLLLWFWRNWRSRGAPRFLLLLFSRQTRHS